MPRVSDTYTNDRLGPDFLLDTAAIQKRLDARQQINLRRKEGRFRFPYDASANVLERRCHEEIGLWVSRLDRQGWQLVSDVTLTPRAARDDMGVAVIGMREYVVEGTFKWNGKTPEKTRVELNPATVKQAPDHRLSLKEAVKAWNVDTSKYE